MDHLDLEKLKELWTSGKKRREIAEVLGINVNQLYVYATVLGLPKRRKSPNKKITKSDLNKIIDLWEKGLRLDEIANQIGVSLSTIQVYLRALGLIRKERCPKIPKEKLLELSLKYSDREIAEILGTSTSCIYKTRWKYGIYKRHIMMEERKKKLNELADKIYRLVSRKGVVTSNDMRLLGIRFSRELGRILQEKYRDVRFFKLAYLSTFKYSILPPSLYNSYIIYIKGKERDVVRLLFREIPRGVPKRSIRWLFKMNGVLEELENAIDRVYDNEYLKQKEIKTGSRTVY